MPPPLIGTCEDEAGSSSAGRSSKLEITCAAGAKGHSWDSNDRDSWHRDGANPFFLLQPCCLPLLFPFAEPNRNVLHSVCQKIWKTQQWPQDWKRSVFIPIPKKGSAKECSNYWTITLISQARKVMLKILQARLQQYMNQELPYVQAGFRKGRGTRDQIANICWIIQKAREFQKNIYFFIDYARAFGCVDHNKLWKILEEIGISDYLTCLLRNLYAGQEATVRT